MASLMIQGNRFTYKTSQKWFTRNCRTLRNCRSITSKSLAVDKATRTRRLSIWTSSSIESPVSHTKPQAHFKNPKLMIKAHCQWCQITAPWDPWRSLGDTNLKSHNSSVKRWKSLVRYNHKLQMPRIKLCCRQRVSCRIHYLRCSLMRQTSRKRCNFRLQHLDTWSNSKTNRRRSSSCA